MLLYSMREMRRSGVPPTSGLDALQAAALVMRSTPAASLGGGGMDEPPVELPALPAPDDPFDEPPCAPLLPKPADELPPLAGDVEPPVLALVMPPAGPPSPGETLPGEQALKIDGVSPSPRTSKRRSTIGVSV